jgi:hypothetical protein
MWHKLKPEIFYKSHCEIENYLISLQRQITQEKQQRGET